MVLKVDIKRAFDAVKRPKLGKLIVEWCGESYPAETACLLDLLKTSSLVIALPWGEVNLSTTTGVKQGSTESPILFSKLVDVLLERLPAQQGPLFADLAVQGTAFMDDTILWQSSLEAMQIQLNALVALLAEYGLFLQPKKCQLVCSGAVGGGKLRVGVDAIEPQPAGKGITVMNLPAGAGVCEMDVIVCLLDRARAKYYSIKHMLVSSAPLNKRLQLLEKVVMGCMRWIVGAVFPTAKIQQQLNAAQIQCLKEMLHIHRRAGELWVDFEVRACREARAVLWREQVPRWGDIHLRQFWRYAGHRARAQTGEHCTIAGLLTGFRDLGWWLGEQGSSVGNRHSRRHYPHIMAVERAIGDTIGGPHWKTAAANRQQWKGLEDQWVEKQRVAWTSCRQLSLCM